MDLIHISLLFHKNELLLFAQFVQEVTALKSDKNRGFIIAVGSCGGKI